EHHGDKLLAWLKGDPQRHLIVIAYDDRDVTLNGKPIVSATGGTWRASFRMIERFKRDVEMHKGLAGWSAPGVRGDLFDTYYALDGQIHFFLHQNPERKILHTMLVGPMSGFVEAIAEGTPLARNATPFGLPVDQKWI